MSDHSRPLPASPDPTSRGAPDSGPTARPWLVLAALWVVGTLALLLFRRGYTFPPFELLDSWIYTSYQWDWRNQITDFGQTYYGSRLSWILPGAFFHSLLPPVAANLCYKLLVSALFATACGTIVYRVAGLAGAALAVTLSLFSPQFIGALHADYVDTPVIVYAALALACITTARYSPRWWIWIFVGGCFFAGMTVANLSSFGTPGLGIAVFHLLWLRWGFKRQLACIGLYLLALATVLVVIGGISAWAGGPFYFLRPQVNMMLYFHAQKTNPWTAANWLWIYGATWLVVPATTLLWGVKGALVKPAGGDEPRRLILALTAALLVSVAWSVQLEFKGVGVLVYYYYASYHLCIALPLLAVLCTCGGAAPRSSLLWTGLLVAALITMSFVGKPLVAWTSLVPLHRLLPTPESVPLLIAALLLLAGLLGSLKVVPAALRRCCRPEILLLGLIACSISTGFHGREISDHLRERYVLIHRTYRLLAREFPRGSYIFWVHPEERNGVSLASTKLWGYRMITVNGFPQLDNIRFTEKTVIIPATLGRADEVLAVATRTLADEGNDLITPRIIHIRGTGGQGFDLVTFRMQKHPFDPDLPAKAGAKPTVMLMAFLAEGDTPYTRTLGYRVNKSVKEPRLDLRPGYPVFTPSDSGDHAATQYHACPPGKPGQNRQMSIVTVMPAAGDVLCTVQDQNFRHLARLALSEPGRKVFRVELPPEVTSLRVVFENLQGHSTPLPTQIRFYEIPE